ncbi:ankyrin repeat protein [Daldinia childiae]|uniref:ankyrin repeat protein n=1 Tax=Daldinia childiae TaxID=326645 RepID=UPI001444F665|nr:ankyrin repeat protein [Daldinia childiae]KAF3059672.1 ankyrin repeat protein [Daldinia childiae]
MSLHNDAAAGVLTHATLNNYLNTCKINEPSTENGNGTIGLTPLALAARNGHADTVRLLLEKGAAVDALSSQLRSPLWIVTARGQGDNRAEIVQLLLRYGADPKYSLPTLQNGSTPLENELKQQKDREVIQLLVQNGGKTDNVITLAASLGIPEINDIMEPSKQGVNVLETIVSLILAVILYIFSWVHTAALAARSVLQRYPISGRMERSMVDTVGKGLSPPKTKEDFEKNISDFVAKHKLGKFFREDSQQLLEGIAAKAVELQGDDTSVLGQPENSDNLIKLALYQPVIYCDDSGSMDPMGNNDGENRMGDQRDLVNRVASICTRIVPDELGVHLRFINNEPENIDNLRMDEIQNIMKQVRPLGCTEIGTQLRNRILQPLLYSQYNENVKSLRRPLFISIITDGIPYGGGRSPETRNTLRDEIKKCQEYLLENGLPSRTVVFQISQIGSDKNSKEFLQSLKEENLENVYITAQQLDSKFRELRKNEKDLEAWLFETLLEPILDKKSG